MKLGFFNDWTLGVVKGDHIVDVSELLGGVHAHTAQELIELVVQHFDQLRRPFEQLAQVSEGVPLSQVKIRPPVPRPDNIVCMSANYLENGTRPMPDIDAFIKSSDCVVGDGDTIHLDPDCKASIFHHEAEFAVVIGKDSDHVSQADADDHVFGYTGFIDVSGRGFAPEGRVSFFQQKNWATFGPMGPFLVTKDEIPDPHKVDLRITNNGEPRQVFNTNDMAHKIPECIEFVTRIMPLHAGDILSTGTNHQGIGSIQDGDELAFEVEHIGTLRVKVSDPLKRTWERGIDHAMAEQTRRGGQG